MKKSLATKKVQVKKVYCEEKKLLVQHHSVKTPVMKIAGRQIKVSEKADFLFSLETK